MANIAKISRNCYFKDHFLSHKNVVMFSMLSEMSTCNFLREVLKTDIQITNWLCLDCWFCGINIYRIWFEFRQKLQEKKQRFSYWVLFWGYKNVIHFCLCNETSTNEKKIDNLTNEKHRWFCVVKVEPCVDNH